MPFPACVGRKWSTIPLSYVEKFLSCIFDYQQSETSELATRMRFHLYPFTHRSAFN